MLHNPKMCLTVFSAADTLAGDQQDPNAGARLSLLGSAATVSGSRADEFADAFFKLYPDSKAYQQTHDFEFYRLEVERARFIGGFGDIHWIEASDWLIEGADWQHAKQGMIDHMNQDHRDAMQLISQYRCKLELDEITMLNIHPDGYFYTAPGLKPMFQAFDQLALSAEEVRKQLVALTHEARAALNQQAS